MPEQQKSINEVLNELWQLVLSYGRQETLEPLKGLGRYIGFGIASVFMGTAGILMLTLAAMRALETHTEAHLSGHWNWVPYAAGLGVLGVLIALAIMRIAPKGEKTR